MNPKWAEENLQTIRTLMERSALYRRALAPIMIFVGVMGILGGLVGLLLNINHTRSFLFLWLATAVLALTGALLLVRRQALKDSEPFWSPPARRVAQALMPAFFIGLVAGVFALSGEDSMDIGQNELLIVTIWTLLYGCAIHAAGFFMPRGIRWLGWIFVISGLIAIVLLWNESPCLLNRSPHLFMAAIFGGLHLAYGIYLYFTEKQHPAA